MSKNKIKEIIGIIIFAIVNISIAYLITIKLGIVNTVVIRTFSALYSEITWEVIIFLGLSLIEAIIYEYKPIKIKTSEEQKWTSFTLALINFSAFSFSSLNSIIPIWNF